MIELTYRGQLYNGGPAISLYEGSLKPGEGKRLIRRHENGFYYRDDDGKLQLILEPVLVLPPHLTLTTEGK